MKKSKKRWRKSGRGCQTIGKKPVPGDGDTAMFKKNKWQTVSQKQTAHTIKEGYVGQDMRQPKRISKKDKTLTAGSPRKGGKNKGGAGGVSLMPKKTPFNVDMWQNAEKEPESRG